jgi:hypothetical protein
MVVPRVGWLYDMKSAQVLYDMKSALWCCSGHLKTTLLTRRHHLMIILRCAETLVAFGGGNVAIQAQMGP